jgi:hypothetical protein
MSLIYALTLPPATATDVVKAELSETVNGIEVVKDATDGAELKYEDGDVVALKVRFTDDAGNVGEWGPALEFTAADIIAPPAAGAPTVNLLRED